MYWLRRIPAETRIVVLVVFLALFQAILLSVFGLGAIRGERRQVAEQLSSMAEDFVQIHVADRCAAELRDRAEEVFVAAFDRRDPEWRQGGQGPGRGLFTDAFHVQMDGRILTPGGAPLWLPRGEAEREEQAARERSKELLKESRGLDAERKRRLHLDFALRYPLARDLPGGSLAIAHALEPLMAGKPPDARTLLEIRWVAVLNRIAGYVSAAECESLVAQVARVAGDDARFAAGLVEQERRARILEALVAERPRFLPGGAPALHRNVVAPRELLFYVRPVGSDGDLQVLAVDPERLRGFLDGMVAAAKRRAADGVAPAIRATGSPGPAADIAVPIAALPGYEAVARISQASVRERAADRARFYWYIIGFSVLGIVAGGLLTARLMMREVKLAKLKSGFVSNVSHGLKTPLTSIRMFSEMLRSGKVKDEAERRECLDVIAQETDRLGRLIQQVLDFGRLAARRRAFRWRIGSLAPVITREVERFRRTTGLDEESFQVSLAVNLPVTTHDPEAFAEVVANLLSNAYKYTEPEKRRIELTLGPQRGRLVLAVVDNGPGIPPRQRRKIFEQFYRANDLLTRDVEGTGLGLSIVRNIVRAHGGRIFVEDAAGGGSRFVVVLPAAPRRRPASPPTPVETPR